MSSYSQTVTYNQFSSSSHPFDSFPPRYSYAVSPPPQPTYLLNPNSFRQEFTSRLSELTVNSRPIIQSLSTIAQDYSRYADVVVQCIEQHIRQVPPWIKLTAWYLLDAISKNINDPYAPLFASIITPLFLESYASVDQSTRSKMEEMLLTWRTGAPSGHELFGVGPQLAIERGIWSSQTASNGEAYAPRRPPSSKRSKASRQKATHPKAPMISQAQVISEIEASLSKLQNTLQVNPYDTQAEGHIGVLRQLRAVVEAGVSQKQLRQILEQLHTLSRPTPSQPIVAIPPPADYTSSALTGRTPAPSALPVSRPRQFPISSEFSEGPSSHDLHLPLPVVSSTVVPPIPNISNLVDALVKAGVVSNSSSTPSAANDGKESRSDAGSEGSDPKRQEERVYRDAVLAHGVKLTTADINRRRPELVPFIYDRLPAQCKQCGMRFPDSVLGKKNMQEHLDMHFRQNRKQQENVSRGHCRSWFISLEDWMYDNSKGPGSSGSSRPVNARKAAAAEAAKREAELRAQCVVVPPGDEAKPIACPICKEILKSEFQEDDEDWVWRNAVDVDGMIYHATCRDEALSSASALTARLRIGLGNRSHSRSTTPEVTSARATPPRHMSPMLTRPKSESPRSSVIGVKRKSSEDDTGAVTADGIDGEGGSPPLKKMAITSGA